MTFKATVMAVHALKPGESIGYGAAYKVPPKSNETVHAAILSAGYADGIPRALSNQGHAWINGRASRFLGMVSMDISAVAATAATRPGDMAEIIGPHVDLWAQARAAGTIPYELLTSLSARVQRQYG
jgi:alanine racemase